MSQLVSHLLREAISAAERLGYHVVVDWLDSCGGGICEVAGVKWLMLDHGGTDDDRLNQVVRILQDDARTGAMSLSRDLARLVETYSERRAA